MARRGWAVWLRWLWANGACLAALSLISAGGYAVSRALGVAHAADSLDTLASAVLALTTLPFIVVGWLQWSLLGQHRRCARPWGAATVVGQLLGWLAVGVLAGAIEWLGWRGLPRGAIPALWAGLVGIGVGAAQQIVLRRYSARVAWWGLASALGGFAAGGGVALVRQSVAIDGHSMGGQVASVTLGGGVGGVIYGAITGLVLVRLFRHPLVGSLLLADEAVDRMATPDPVKERL